jgi:uncharacterized protein
MNLAAINSVEAAFVAGVVTSLHCTAMCGPIACWLMPARSGDDRATLYMAYQGSRLSAYALLGALMGLLGQAPLILLKQSALTYLSWAMVLFFVLVALGVDRRWKKPFALTKLGGKVLKFSHGRSSTATALIIGAATPLLPCGPLYLVAALSGLTGSAVKGMEFMLAFGLGTLPLLWVTQLFLASFRGKLQPVWFFRIQRGLAVAAALLIVWRLRGTLGFGPGAVGEWICF